MIPITIPALSMLAPGISLNSFFSCGLTNSSAKYPYTTVGIALRSSSVGLSNSRRENGAYSLR